jgi:hypothetical protein
MIPTTPNTGQLSEHCARLEHFLSYNLTGKNLVFLQFVWPPRGNSDPDYSPVKHMVRFNGAGTSLVPDLFFM